MANSEVSRLKFNNTTYDIADELARQNIGVARSEIATEAARLDAVDTGLAGRITNLENSAGAVLVAKTKSAMSDTSKIYVYTGSESGMTRGNWYYHNGSAWVSGGAYNQNLDAIDATLTQSNKGADAKVTGDRLTAAETDISKLRGTIANEYTSQAYAVGDYCYYNGLLYRCNTAISVGETWTSSHWTAVDVMPELNNLKNDLINRFVSKGNATEGYFIDTRTGAVSVNANFAYLDFGVFPGDTIVYCAARADTNIGLCFYDADGAFITGVESTATEQTVLVPDSAVSAKASYRIAKADQAYVKLGASISPLVNRVTMMDAECARIVDGYLSKDDAVTGYAINSLDGSRMAQANLSYLEFPVLTGSKLVYNAGRDDSPVGLAFYDAEGVYVSGVSSSEHGQVVTVPDTAVIARASYRTHLADVAFVKILTDILPLVEAVRASNAVVMTLNGYCGLSMFGSVHFLGDSYTQGGIKSSDGSTWRKAKKPYPEVIGGELGITVKNFGIGGASVRSYLTDGLPSVLAEDAPDLYVICYGINDAGHGDTIGTVNDINDEDYTLNADTFFGNYGRLIAQLKQHAPLARFVIFGQWHWNSGGIRYMDYSEAARGVAEHFGIPFVDPFSDAFFTSLLYRTTMVSGHPTQVTYTGMAHAVMRLMTDCISDNDLYYRYAGLEVIS